MHRASSPLLSWLALAGVVLALGCSPTQRTESARLVISLPPDAPGSDVTRVAVTLTASDLAPRALELVRSGEAWSDVMAHIPEGPARTFSAEAFDSSGVKRFAGRAENIRVTAGRELVVTFTLEPTGSASLDASLNHRPVLASLSASPSRVDVGQTTTVTASVSDADGDALTYQWSATGCTGTLADATSTTARFTPSARPSGDACGSCRLEFLASDGRGGQARGSLGLCVGASPQVTLAPQIVDTDISDTTVGIGQHVQLGVRAWDPQGSALTFSWERVIGHFHGSPTHTATTSQAVWVVPSCIPYDANPPLRLVVRNAHGQTAVTTFPIFYDGVPTCNTHWTASGSMATPRQGHAATLLNSGKVLVTGGSNGTQVLPSAEVYDPATGTWTPTGDMNAPRTGHTATLLDTGKVLVVGGYSATPYESHMSAELYDPATGTWAYTASMDTPRYWHSAVKLSWGAVLITGGLNGYDQLSNVELYLPEGVWDYTGQWEYQGDMGAIRYQHTSTLLQDNRVLVTGGKGTSSNTAEVYDQMTGQFTPAGTLGRTRSRHTATLLPSGKVLIVGGTNGGGALATAEFYDTATGLWGPASTLIAPHEGHTTLLLGSGQVFVTGGVSAGTPSATTELYSP
ncbi:Kelch repeat-containing protein [Archangium sp.]|uniref:Kelch repeat-containing protein n=1 Tax=Archangium sp. TaxID=1872627 RepID=UPI002D7640EC|nr:kelch repeat-containing protein [Archangium sp.]HYO54297.1 kelch repeat-containing protein [Archangium sp.]